MEWTLLLREKGILNVLVDIIKGIILEFFKRIVFSEKKEELSIPQANIDKENIVEEVQKPKISDTLVRLKLAYKLLFENELFENKIHQNKIVDDMDLKNERVLLDILHGSESPDNSFLRKFSILYNINYLWLTQNEGTIFPRGQDEKYPISYFDYILAQEPELVYIVREKKGYTGIVLQDKKGNFCALKSTFKLNKDVGDIGRTYIVQFYDLVKKLNGSAVNNRMFGRELDSNLFHQIFNGENNPKVIGLNNYKEIKNCFWYADWMDLSYERNSKEWCSNMYGEAFVESQQIVFNERILCS